jgi:hypothetical protein
MGASSTSKSLPSRFHLLGSFLLSMVWCPFISQFLLLLYNAWSCRFWHSSCLCQLAMTAVRRLVFNLFK